MDIIYAENPFPAVVFSNTERCEVRSSLWNEDIDGIISISCAKGLFFDKAFGRFISNALVNVTTIERTDTHGIVWLCV